ncbi:MFS transporter [Alysiella filiformis]|uniref:Uncharacterized protein n=1 Tax=Alysiella filiformis DSM 16848 TaxID=1120981 RepID=A0A286EDL9_9NEIS|nr:hypothetical protein [Alysiella filiformis]QMT31714.1 hypothetical protein H3L97_02110 [Alysiella filiformis]UBQ55275.1 hypothetical protein JF568_06565 [Alysiella filiformis DSM 16848]SOD69002.1 hypothetical protein SAMN02746062_01477 [Alysiella filiformis DSM 16848]
MINLYQILHISPHASRVEIQAALQHYRTQPQAHAKIIRATEEWLLVADVRARYDARLRAEQPEVFQAATPHHDDVLIVDETPAQAIENDEYYVPILWQPKAIMLASLILTPALGAWLTALNWQELGDEKAKQINMQVAYAVLGSSLVLAMIAILTGVDWGWWLHLVVWLAWFFTLGKKHMDFVDNAIGNDYNRQSWQKTLIWVAVALVAYVLLIMLLMYLAIQLDWAHPSWFA